MAKNGLIAFSGWVRGWDDGVSCFTPFISIVFWTFWTGDEGGWSEWLEIRSLGRLHSIPTVLKLAVIPFISNIIGWRLCCCYLDVFIVL